MLQSSLHPLDFVSTKYFSEKVDVKEKAWTSIVDLPIKQIDNEVRLALCVQWNVQIGKKEVGRMSTHLVSSRTPSGAMSVSDNEYRRNASSVKFRERERGVLKASVDSPEI